jgi:radical SAM-linked protein
MHALNWGQAVADFRLRINYQKVGPFARLSHLELVRAMERTVRRSGLPYAISQGFNVHMRHAFGPALPVGTAGLDEYLDVELVSFVPPKQALALLKAVAVEHLPVVGASYVSKAAPSLQVSHCLASYVLEVRTTSAGFAAWLLETLDTTSAIEVTKKKKAKIYQLDEYLCKPFAVRAAEQISGVEGHYFVDMTLKANPGGSLRPEVVLGALVDDAHPLEIIAITRTKLCELPQDSAGKIEAACQRSN